MNTNEMTFDEILNAVYAYLSDYESRCMDDCLKVFGHKEDVMNKLLYVWYGEESEAFLNTVSDGYYYSE